MGTQTAAAMVADAKGRVENLTPDAVEREARDGVLLVDIREPDERQGGGISGSIYAARSMLEFYADPTSPYHRPGFDPERRIVLYCARRAGARRWPPTCCRDSGTATWLTSTGASRRGSRPASRSSRSDERGGCR